MHPHLKMKKKRLNNEKEKKSRTFLFAIKNHLKNKYFTYPLDDLSILPYPLAMEQ
jgi:hypothetical protein